MKVPTFGMATAVLVYAGLSLGGIIDRISEVDMFNSTEDASIFDEFVFLNSLSPLPPPPGEKVPGDNFFSLCGGDHSLDIIRFDRVDLTPNPPQR